MNFLGLPGFISSLNDASAQPIEDDVIYFGMIPRDNPRIAYEKYQPLIDYLTDSTPYTFELVLGKTIDDTVNALGNGNIDIALLSPLSYLHARSEFGVVSILRGIAEDGGAFYRSVIVVKQSSPIENIAELKGKDIAFASLKSTSGNLIPRYLLADAGIHLRELGAYRNFDYHDSVAKWVLKGKYDAGAVRESVAYKYLPMGLRVIAVSQPIPTGPIVVGINMPQDVIAAIKYALLSLNTAEDRNEIIGMSDPELKGGFIEASDSDYEDIRRMINNVPTTCGIGCHPKISL